MKRCLWVLINKIFIDELELMYGKGSYVDVNTVKYCTTNKNFLVDCKLYISDIKLFEEIMTGGLEVLIEDAWKWSGVGEQKFAYIITYDLI
jgi:hypothetical protein